MKDNCKLMLLIMLFNLVVSAQFMTDNSTIISFICTYAIIFGISIGILNCLKNTGCPDDD